MSVAPPKKQSVGRPLVIGGVLIGALASGFLVWNAMRPAPAPEPEPEPAKPVAAPVVAREAEAPPPPPMEVEPPAPQPPPTAEVKPEVEKPVAKRPSGCDGTCKGIATAQLQSALRSKAGQARSCYERALTHNSSLAGSALVNLRIGSGGETCSASVGKDTLGEPQVMNCVVQRFKSGKFPKPAGGCVDVAVPLSFVPAQR